MLFEAAHPYRLSHRLNRVALRLCRDNHLTIGYLILSTQRVRRSLSSESLPPCPPGSLSALPFLALSVTSLQASKSGIPFPASAVQAAEDSLCSYGNASLGLYPGAATKPTVFIISVAVYSALTMGSSYTAKPDHWAFVLYADLIFSP